MPFLWQEEAPTSGAEVDPQAHVGPELIPSPSGFVLFAITYVLAALLGQQLTLDVTNGISLWPPSGIFLAVLLQASAKFWFRWIATAVAVDLAVNAFAFGFPVGLSVVISTGNAVEAIVGAAALRHWSKGRFELRSVRSVLALTVFAALLSPLCSAALGGTAMSRHSGDPLATSWLLWWSGDAAGVLVFAPLVLWIGQHRQALARQIGDPKALEGSLLIAALLLVGHGVFSYRISTLFLLLPILMWAALQLGFVGAALASAIVTMQAAFYTSRGLGPFASALVPAERQLVVQTFVMTTTVTALLFAGLARQRADAQKALAESLASADARIIEQTRQLRASEAQLQELVASLREADRFKDDFLATLAHELRNPLAPLRNGLWLLSHAEDDDRARKLEAMMERQISQMTRLVDDLLDISRVRSGKIELNLQLVDLVSLAAQAVETMRPSAESQRHTLTTEFSGDPVWVAGDSSRLTQVICNLLANSIRYTPPGGTVTVAVRSESGRGIIRVSDTGSGISPDLLPRIFDMYAQGVQTGPRTDRGLGIGLALVKRLVDLHGGSVHAFSAGVGHGAMFTVSLPLAPAGEGADPGMEEVAEL
jgi:signal transduction histidine kinase